MKPWLIVCVINGSHLEMEMREISDTHAIKIDLEMMVLAMINFNEEL